MSTLTKEQEQALAAPFEPGQIKQREGRGGMKFDYVDARAVQRRLDEVVGVTGWSTSYRVIDPERWAVECQLTVLGVTKADVGYPNSDRDDEQEPLKAAYSDAFKRSAVSFGVGRHLYDKAPQRSGGHLIQAARDAGFQDAPRPAGGTTEQQFRERLAAPVGASSNGGGPKASEKQLKAVWAISKGRNVDPAAMTAYMLDTFGTNDQESLTSKQCSALIDWLQKQGG